MRLQLYNTKTMKLEIMTLEQCEPGTIYLVPKIVRCKKCECIIQFHHGWQCPDCGAQWSMADYANYFGTIQLDDEKPKFKLRILCKDCEKLEKSNIHQQIEHRVQWHSAIYMHTQRTLRYWDHINDVIPPEMFRKVVNEST